MAHDPSTTTNTASPLKKTTFSTSNPYEERFGYCRAVRKGPFIAVAGTTAVDPATQKLLYPGDAGRQAAAALALAFKGLTALGAKGPEDVIRARVFISNADDSVAIGNAYRDALGKDGGEIGAAMTMVTAGFVDPEMLVEIELDAVVD